MFAGLVGTQPGGASADLAPSQRQRHYFSIDLSGTVRFQPCLERAIRDRSESRRQPNNDRTYDAEVAGKPVGYALAAIQTFLWERAIPNPFIDSLPWDFSSTPWRSSS